MRKLIYLILFSFFPISCFAKQIVFLGVEAINYFPLYGTFDEKDNPAGDYEGYASEVFSLFNKSQDKYQFKIKPLPIKRLFKEYLEEKSLDAKFPDNEMWSSDLRRDKKIYYSDSVISYTDGIFIKKENKNKIDINKVKSIGTMTGFTPFEYLKYLQSNGGKMELQESDSTTSLLQKVAEGKIEIAYVNVQIGNSKLKKLDLSETVVYEDKLPHSESNYYLSSMKYPDLISEFNKFLQVHHGELVKLKHKFELPG